VGVGGPRDGDGASANRLPAREGAASPRRLAELCFHSLYAEEGRWLTVLQILTDAPPILHCSINIAAQHRDYVRNRPQNTDHRQ